MAEGLIADTKIFRCSIHFTHQLQQMQTGWHVRERIVPLIDAEDVAPVVAEFAEDQFSTILSPLCKITRVEVEEITSKQFFQQEFPNLPGTASGGDGPTFLAASIALRSNVRSRWRNGRMFWPLQKMGYIDNSGYTSGGLAALQQVIDDWTSRFITGGILGTSLRAVNVTMGLPARTGRPEVPPSWIDVEAVRLNPLVSSHRKRKVGVGA